MRSTTLRWIGLALLGIVIAAGVAVAASSLVSHQIGLASEPLSAGDSLAPARLGTHQHRGRATPHRPQPPVTTPAPPPIEEPEPADGGDGGGADD